MDELTALQLENERRLGGVLAELGTSLVNREVLGVSETYVTGRIDGTKLVVYLYANGEAQMHGPGEEHIFELADFGRAGHEALWAAFEVRVRVRVLHAQGARQE